MKLLITGASSTLAARLVALLLVKSEFSLRLLEHCSLTRIEPCITITADMSDPESLDRACQLVDWVLHMAALTHSCIYAEYFRVNRGGIHNLINACKKNGVRKLIFISSVAASDDTGAYGSSKLKAET